MMQKRRQLQGATTLDTIAWRMNNDELLEQFGKLIDTKLNEKLESIKTDVQTVKKVVNHISTGIEALAAGQQDMKEKMATKADVQGIKADLVKQQRRIENVEENTKTPNPHKN
jgi:methyl-accepting chemotaxis protein